ncbi:uncharacterized protein N7484_002694 [Penicillium longicatenatum]|uniref:uncharacterized protein n=1 Tax=Penicillium longicatenatum TaxID=1561947 RepID=UPI00254839E0|nr:uncharacterized protein N7484_002694 [Penicillium longicatenatum]KAJ5648971.1 hypothetical protein N7484_002694 [Penicillium longicatenatum]
MPTLVSLPRETLEQICGFVASDDFPSLLDLALTCKSCSVATNKYRFRCIDLTIVGRKKLRRDIQQWHEILERTDSFTSVRILIVRGKLPLVEEDDDSRKPDPEYNYNHWSQRDCNDELKNLEYNYGFSSMELCRPPSISRRDDWGSLPTLVARFHGLRDLIWGCGTMFPPCLLDILHHALPRCKLHNLAFFLPSLCYDTREPRGRDIDEYEFSLATSPSLSSIVFPAFEYDPENDPWGYNDWGKVEYHEEAVMQLASGLAPNLKSVSIIAGTPEAVPGIYDELRRDRLPWPGFFPSDPKKIIPTPNQGQLRELSIGPAALVHFEAWEARGIFPDLRVLRLWKTTLETLLKAGQCQFPSLKTLVLEIGSPREAAADAAASAFVSSLPRLESIHLTGSQGDKALKAVLDHHGKSLHKISFQPEYNSEGDVITADWINQIRNSCPNIRDLQLPIPRTGGNDQEVAIYRTLGEMPQLTDLSLQLVCAGYSQDDRGPFSSSYLVTDGKKARELLINFALDATLAQEIFLTIGKNSSLQRLNLNVQVFSCPATLWQITEFMDCEWRCIRASGDRVIVRKPGQPREINNGSQTVEIGEECELDEFEPVFRDLWPKKHERWVYDWHSFPLQTSANNT